MSSVSLGIDGAASSDSIFSASFDVDVPREVVLDVDLQARVKVQQGTSFPISQVRFSFCELGGSCLVERVARDQGAAGSPDRVTFIDTLVLAPGAYSVSVVSLAAADARTDGQFFGSECDATWDVMVTLPEPSPGALAVAALLVLALVRRRSQIGTVG